MACVARVYWLCQIAGWSAYAVANVLLWLLRDRSTPPWRIVVAFTSASILALAGTHGYRWVIRRWGWVQLGLARLGPRVIAASVVVGAAITASAMPVWAIVIPSHAGTPGIWLLVVVMIWVVSVLIWSVVYFGVHSVLRVRQLELAQLQLAVVAKDAQLHGLMAQLQPHFLFNCLNSVRGLIVEDPARAQATVTALSDLMRYALRDAARPTVPLATELDMVRTYLALETVRFEERLRSEIEVGDDTTGLRVPAMLVQLLVENGVKHGIERTPAGGTIRVAAWRDRDMLRIRVGSPGRIGESPPSTQIGLVNARQRLRLIYGPAATLALRDDPRGVVAEVSLPLADIPDPVGLLAPPPGTTAQGATAPDAPAQDAPAQDAPSQDATR